MKKVRCFCKKTNAVLTGGKINYPLSITDSNVSFLKVQKSNLVIVLSKDSFIDSYQYVEVNAGLMGKIKVLAFNAKTGEINKVLQCTRHFGGSNKQFSKLVVSIVDESSNF